MRAVALTTSILMLLLGFFDNPHGEGMGQLQPTAMERSLRIIDSQVLPLDAADRTTRYGVLCRPLSRRGLPGVND